VAARGGLFFRLGTFCARNAWKVVGVWLGLLVVATLAHVISGGTYSDDFVLPDSETQQGVEVLSDHVPNGGQWEAPVVFTVPDGTLGQHTQAIEASIKNLEQATHVVTATDPLQPGTLANDGRTAYSNVSFDANPRALGLPYIPTIDQAVAPARADGVEVDYAGLLGIAAEPKPLDLVSEIVGIGIALIVLLIGFGSVHGATLPIVAAGIGVGTGIGILGFVASMATFATVSPTLGLMMGLGVGIDYGLFLTTRYRQFLIDGVDPMTAAGKTVATSGRAVLVAATTVVLAMLGLYASGMTFIGKLGVAAGITVSVAAAAALTLVPAMLFLLGNRIDKLAVRRVVAEEAPSDSTDTPWHRYAERVSRHPWLHLGAGVLALLVLAIPLLSMNLGQVDAGSSPTSYSERRAHDALASAFGVGMNAPFTVVIQLPDDPAAADGAAPPHHGKLSDAQKKAAAERAVRNIVDVARMALGNDPGVAQVTPFQVSKDGEIAYGNVLPTTDPQNSATRDLMTRMRDTTLPDALKGTGATALVTGPEAGQFDFRNQVAERLPWIIGVVIATAFVLLLLTFRSPLLALKAGVLNLLSIGAAYGVIVAVFQWGWGGPLIGVHEHVPIEHYVPMMMFAIVFGLSMDYEVFLLSRVREAWVRHGDNTASVADGLSVTARVITCAALIMASVFIAFVLSPDIVVKEIALGLGVSVLVDATIIRLVVVPSTMFLLGRLNWWTPSWLDRLLPRFDPEGEA